MPTSKDFLTTQQFAAKAGVSASTVSKWIRKGRLKGEKKGGKWLIPAVEIDKTTAAPAHGAAPENVAAAPVQKRPEKSPSAASSTVTNSYSIKEFSDLTYLTEYGVKKWLKEGRLIMDKDGSGQPRVDASNLDIPAIKRLVR